MIPVKKRAIKFSENAKGQRQRRMAEASAWAILQQAEIMVTVGRDLTKPDARDPRLLWALDVLETRRVGEQLIPRPEREKLKERG